MENVLPRVQTRRENGQRGAASFGEHAVALVRRFVFSLFLCALFVQIVSNADRSFHGIFTDFDLVLSGARELFLHQTVLQVLLSPEISSYNRESKLNGSQTPRRFSVAVAEIVYGFSTVV